jgi:hypothetical protein
MTTTEQRGRAAWPWAGAALLALVAFAPTMWRVDRAVDPHAAVFVAHVGEWDLLDQSYGMTTTWGDRSAFPEVTDPWGRPFVLADAREVPGALPLNLDMYEDTRVFTPVSLGPDGVRSADDVPLVRASARASRAWRDALVWRWPMGLLLAAWLLALAFAVRLPQRASRGAESALGVLVAVPGILLAFVTLGTAISGGLAGAAGPIGSELALGGSLLALGALSAVGARAWARRPT